jgi:hypothetical protein
MSQKYSYPLFLIFVAILFFHAYISLFHTLQTGSGAHPASYTMDIGAFSPGVKRLGRKASAEVKNGEALSPLFYTSSWHGKKKKVKLSL